jgi:sulfate transport system ATP-binding protein
VHFDGQPIGLGAVDLKDGAAELFMRPYDVAIVPSEDAGLQGVVRRVHGLGPARRVEIALGRAESETIVEIEAPRSQPLSVGQVVGLRPQQYRIFPASNE